MRTQFGISISTKDIRMSNISIGTRSSGRSSNSIEITGLTQEEADQLLSAVRGLSWFKVEEGRLKANPCHLPLPDPIHDEHMLPFWRQFSNIQAQGEFLEKMFEDMSDDVIYMPHFTIQSLCGYNYTQENYAQESEKLLSYGFIQTRSKRGEDGHYWELWYLPGVWCVKGDLKEVVDGITAKAKTWEDPHGKRKDKECFNAVLEFLRRNISFGTLDISIQRLCMVMDD
jgi:hypothetical protein